MARLFSLRTALAMLVAMRLEHQWLVAGLRDENVRYGYFVFSFYRRLSVREISSVYVADMMSCVKTCLEDQRCYSVNLAVTPDIDGKLLCQLLATDHYNSGHFIVLSQDFHFCSLLAVSA